MRGYNNSYEGKINTNKREDIMNIKERIKTIIEDYSFAKDEVNVRNNIKELTKGTLGNIESYPLGLCKRTLFYLKLKDMTSYTNSLITRLGDK